MHPSHQSILKSMLGAVGILARIFVAANVPLDLDANSSFEMVESKEFPSLLMYP